MMIYPIGFQEFRQGSYERKTAKNFFQRKIKKELAKSQMD
jgi:hypothetical protein